MWHHRDLGLTVGEPVAQPEQPHLWAQEVPGVVTNQATGDGIRISPEVAARLRRPRKP